ncbi:MAG: enoyl-CoA hydratase/isomerase family protein [Planctomycetota bacterium]|nr:enoyl-CoA hydratase/isomerase family protein [Planctomycetota bacterium]MDA1105448.1 enoyl-CoA hydratase/isomerase family protein [Planctomycetota bacterium]
MLVDRTDLDGIVRLTLHRPESRNALNLDLVRDLRTRLEAVRDDPSARVVVLAGAGKAFCAGMDLRGVATDPVAMGTMLRELAQTTVLLRNLHCPSVAVVQGAAIGGGCGLMVVCDLAITHPEAKLGYPEVDMGISPAVVAPWLIRKIGAGRARAMLLMGGTITGTRASELGLVDRVVPLEELEPETGRVAAQFREGGRAALAVTKRWLNELDGSWQAETVLRGAELSAEVIMGPEAQQRLSAKVGQGSRSRAS